MGDAFGEIVGSSILALGVLLQYDELLDFSKDRLETGLIVGGLYGFGRILAYKS